VAQAGVVEGLVRVSREAQLTAPQGEARVHTTAGVTPHSPTWGKRRKEEGAGSVRCEITMQQHIYEDTNWKSSLCETFLR
jgi:hypothetical protein